MSRRRQNARPLDTRPGTCSRVCGMTTATEYAPRGEAPTWTRGDRMRRAAREAGMTGVDMAEYLGVTRQTVSAWLTDHRTPGPMALRLWALRTGVPLEWLERGE